MRKRQVFIMAAFAAIFSLLLCGCSAPSFEEAEAIVTEHIVAMTGAGEESPAVAESSVTVTSDQAVRDEEDAFSLFGFPVGGTDGLSGFAYDQLEENVQSVYAQLYTGVSERKQKFTLNASDTEDIKSALSALIIDHPEFFWIDGNAGMSGYKALGIWQISLDFTVNADEIDSIAARIDEKANEYLASLPEGASDYDKVRAAYEYIIRTTDYDTSSRNNQNIMSVFLDGRSVCAGYARALQYLLKKAGVWCAYIEGTTGASMEGHAWNLVYIDGVYTYVDPSWGDPTYGEDATDASRLEIIYDYLCLTSDELMRIRHIPTGVYALPECTDTRFDYYRLNGLFYEGFDPDAVGGAVWHAVDEAERSVFFKFSDFESYQMAVDALFPAEGDEAESLLDAPIRQRMEWDAASSMRYYYSCSDELWIIKIYW